MKNKAFMLIGAILMLCSGVTNATSDGNTITVRRSYPTVTSDYGSGPQQVTVQSGADDSITLQGWAKINLDPTGIYINFLGSSNFVGSSTVFDGYTFSGFKEKIINVQIIKSTVTVNKLSFGDNYISLNLQGAFNSASNIEMAIEFAPIESSHLVVKTLTNSPIAPLNNTGGYIYLNKEIDNLGNKKELVTSFSQLIFPNGESMNIDAPRVINMESNETTIENSRELEIKPWYPAGNYTFKYIAIGQTDGQFYSDSINFTKQQ